MSASTNAIAPTARRFATMPRAATAAPLCPGGVLDDDLLRSWPRSAVAWLIYEIEVAPHSQ